MGPHRGVWLDDAEHIAWRSYLRAHGEVLAELHRRLLARTGLSIADYEVLVHLSEAGGRLRVGELASALFWERSRVSHHVTRMARRGLVERHDCDDDARGAFAMLTEVGSSAIESAAPGHVADVRALFVDPVGADLEALTAASTRILDQLLRNR